MIEEKKKSKFKMDFLFVNKKRINSNKIIHGNQMGQSIENLKEWQVWNVDFQIVRTFVLSKILNC